ncbi:MAG: gliding motility-associated C-terminal domain-containing protein [Bacteroidetes bacterium]|nr:gliding motility-associated C-terminal domain-containing protein [Bacteroidota bacterium]
MIGGIVYMQKATAQPLRTWWSGDYKCIVHDTGLELRNWKLKYPPDINLGSESTASYFDNADSLRYFYPSGGVLYKRSDSPIFTPARGGNGSCYQASICYHDTATDTIYFLGKSMSTNSDWSFTLNIVKVHPNRVDFNVYPSIIQDSLDESMTAMKFANGKIWAIFRKVDSDLWHAVELRSLKSVTSNLKHTKEYQNGASGLHFHPLGKFFFYCTFDINGRPDLNNKILCMNFNSETGNIGFRKLVQLNHPRTISMCFDSTGNLVYFYFYGGGTGASWDSIKQISVLSLLSGLASSTFSTKCIPSDVNVYPPPKFVYGNNDKIYINIRNVGYTVIEKPSLTGSDCDLRMKRLPDTISQNFYGWPDVVMEQRINSTDTFSFFSLPYPLNLEVYIPTAFTPNGDFVNDGFFFSYNEQIQLRDFRIRIFSRWGVEVFSSQDSRFAWDGNFRGKSVPDGTYYYVAQYTHGITGKAENRRGPVVLFR